jgi:hypothetical protein
MSTVRVHNVFVCFVRISKQTPYVLLTDWFSYPKTECLLRGTNYSLSTIQIKLMHVRFITDKVALGQISLPVLQISRQYQSINAPYKRVKLRHFPTKRSSFGFSCNNGQVEVDKAAVWVNC